MTAPIRGQQFKLAPGEGLVPPPPPPPQEENSGGSSHRRNDSDTLNIASKVPLPSYAPPSPTDGEDASVVALARLQMFERQKTLSELFKDPNGSPDSVAPTLAQLSQRPTSPQEQLQVLAAGTEVWGGGSGSGGSEIHPPRATQQSSGAPPLPAPNTQPNRGQLRDIQVGGLLDRRISAPPNPPPNP